MGLFDYVMQHAVRGDCQCGHCADAPPNPKQPGGHTSDLVFFKVAADGADPDEFKSLAAAEFPHWFDGEEHSYLETGADIGDQGAALMAMGLGELLGAWMLVTPRSAGYPESMVMQLAGSGMVVIRAKPARR